MIKKSTFKGEPGGPSILFTGRVHGNEPCGEIALKRLVDNIENGSIQIKKGMLTLMPCCNPKAMELNKRFIDVNLNRIMSADLVETYVGSYESEIAPIIMECIDNHDYFVDVHSFTENMQPVVICIDDRNKQSQKMAEICGVKRIELDSPIITKPGSQMTIHYARHHNKPSILIEAGQHDDPQSVEVAYQAIVNILIHLGMIEGEKPQPINHEFIVARSILYHEEGQKLIFPLMERDYIHEGDPVFETEHGDIIHAHDTGLLFMRNQKTPVGEEYAYICDVYDDWP